MARGKRAFERKRQGDVKAEAKPKPTKTPVQQKNLADDVDSSDEEDLRNTIGNIPVEWYDEYDHIGYDQDGNKIAKTGEKKGEIDQFLDKMEDPDYWRKVFDKQTGTEVVLSDEQIAQIKAISRGQYPTIGYNPYEPFLDLFSSQTEIHPISNRPADKRSFIPSAIERRMVGRIVHAIKMGWRKPKEAKDKTPKVYDMWSSENDPKDQSKSEMHRMRMHWPAPKVALPGHAESFNPPAEYLLSPDELKKYYDQEPEDRKYNFIPQKFDSYRKVPGYSKFYQELFDRCQDLYLAPRQRKLKLHNVELNQLLPDLPDPKDLMPFPTTLAFYMRGHTGQVRAISVEPKNGELLVSGGEDGTVRVWSMDNGRCLKTFRMEGPVNSVAFCPDAKKSLVLVACDRNHVCILNIDCGDKQVVSATQKFLAGIEFEESETEEIVKWSRTDDNNRIDLELPNNIKQVVWQSKGDYFATVSFEATVKGFLIHQLSKGRSHKPFSKKKGDIQCVQFHPTQPVLFLVTKHHVRVYDLQKCQLKRKLFTGSRGVSCAAIGPFGDNLFVGGLDRRISWLDMQLSDKPWKSFRHHAEAVRSVAVHSKYPLLATVSDDCQAIIYHARISEDYMRDNEFIPVKRLNAHTKADHLAMLSTVFHPTQPWLLTAGADGKIGLFTY